MYTGHGPNAPKKSEEKSGKLKQENAKLARTVGKDLKRRHQSHPGRVTRCVLFYDQILAIFYFLAIFDIFWLFLKNDIWSLCIQAAFRIRKEVGCGNLPSFGVLLS